MRGEKKRGGDGNGGKGKVRGGERKKEEREERRVHSNHHPGPQKMGNNQLLLPSVTWHPCHRLMGSWGMGDGPELGMKGQRPDQTSGRHN